MAKLYDFVPLTISGTNVVDAALGKPLKEDLVDPEILGIGLPTGWNLPAPGTTVRKSGRTTGVNWGTIIVTGATVRVGYPELGTLTFTNQVITTAMAKGGDSGSLILDLANRGVALLFTGFRLSDCGKSNRSCPEVFSRYSNPVILQEFRCYWTISWADRKENGSLA